MITHTHPIYEISIDSKECAVELLVNDVPCFSNYRRGGMAVDWPVNTNILATGKQFFSVKILPYKEEQFINKKASVIVKISLRDAFYNPQPKTMICEYSLIEFSQKKDMETYLFSDNFYASVPYLNKGWLDSISIFEEDKKAVLREVSSFYDNLFEIFETKNLERYKVLNQKRYEELCTSLYINSDTMKRREVGMIPKFKGILRKIPLENYILNFYGDGKLVGVNIPYEPKGFKFESDDETDNIVVEQALFHRKKTGDQLSLIR